MGFMEPKRNQKILKNEGLSFLEALITLLIIASLSISGFSAWKDWRQHRSMIETAQQIQHFLYAVRASANWKNSDYVLWLREDEPWCLGAGQKTEKPCEGGNKYQLLAPNMGVKIIALVGSPGFYGKRNVARPGNITFGDEKTRWRIVISSRGRIRLCKEEINGCQ